MPFKDHPLSHNPFRCFQGRSMWPRPGQSVPWMPQPQNRETETWSKWSNQGEGSWDWRKGCQKETFLLFLARPQLDWENVRIAAAMKGESVWASRQHRAKIWQERKGSEDIVSFGWNHSWRQFYSDLSIMGYNKFPFCFTSLSWVFCYFQPKQPQLTHSVVEGQSQWFLELQLRDLVCMGPKWRRLTHFSAPEPE